MTVNSGLRVVFFESLLESEEVDDSKFDWFGFFLQAEDLFVACNQLATTVSEYVKELIMSIRMQLLSKRELQLETTLATKSRQYFERVAFKPSQEAGVIIPVGGESIHSTKTKYQLTRFGLALFDKWSGRC